MKHDQAQPETAIAIHLTAAQLDRLISLANHLVSVASHNWSAGDREMADIVAQLKAAQLEAAREPSTTTPPVEELIAGDEFRKTLIPRADDKANLLWHGWAIMDAFLAGIQWERNRGKR